MTFPWSEQSQISSFLLIHPLLQLTVHPGGPPGALLQSIYAFPVLGSAKSGKYFSCGLTCAEWRTSMTSHQARSSWMYPGSADHRARTKLYKYVPKCEQNTESFSMTAIALKERLKSATQAQSSSRLTGKAAQPAGKDWTDMRGER